MTNENTHYSLPKVAVIILNWNGKEDTLECLASVKKLDYSNYEIVLVDNGSVDDSVDAISKQYPDMTLLQTGENLGYAGGNNVGIRWALEQGADYILLLNNDTIVAADLLSAFINAANVLASGTTRQRIARKSLEEIKVPKPDLEIQNIIANKLDSLLDIISVSKAKIISSQSLQKSLINQIF